MKHQPELYGENLLRVLRNEIQNPNIREVIRLIRKNNSSNLLKQNTFLSMFHLLKNIFLVAGGFFLLQLFWGTWFSILLLPAILLISSCSLYGVISCIHDALHGSFSKYKLVNTLVGVILSPFFLLNVFSVQKSHLAHHRYNQSATKDPKTTILSSHLKATQRSKISNISLKLIRYFHANFYMKYKWFGFFLIPLGSLIFFLYQNLNSEFGLKSIFTNQAKLPLYKKAIYTISVLIIIFIYTFLIQKFGFTLIALTIILPIFLSMGLTILVFFNHNHKYTIKPLDHFDEVLMDFNISNIQSSKWFNWLSNNFHHYHLEHHLMPGAVPHYYLKYITPIIQKSYGPLMAPPRPLMNIETIEYAIFGLALLDRPHKCLIGDKYFYAGEAFRDYFINELSRTRAENDSK